MRSVPQSPSGEEPSQGHQPGQWERRVTNPGFRDLSPVLYSFGPAAFILSFRLTHSSGALGSASGSALDFLPNCEQTPWPFSFPLFFPTFFHSCRFKLSSAGTISPLVSAVPSPRGPTETQLSHTTAPTQPQAPKHAQGEHKVPGARLDLNTEGVHTCERSHALSRCGLATDACITFLPFTGCFHLLGCETSTCRRPVSSSEPVGHNTQSLLHTVLDCPVRSGLSFP